MEYPKINSLWKREGWYFEQDMKNSPDYQKGRQSFIVGDYADEAFKRVKNWRVTEKINGTNIRICFKQVQGVREEPFIGGRTEQSSISAHLLRSLKEIAKWENFDRAIQTIDDTFECWVFGEGYGPKIKSGDYYRDDAGLILFDVKMNKCWKFVDFDVKMSKSWMSVDDVSSFAAKFGIGSVPDLGVMSEEEIVKLVKSKPISHCSAIPHVMEGIVARAEPLVYDDGGNPLRFKLKCKEFE